ncbi:MAG: hypothetical protein HY702_02265, partial [Gemmatimonadetes bacterium]|nr:hypothetical protein [Gemmatimonadota bacterium]
MRRYHIETTTAPDVAPHPSRFRVKVKKHRLALLLLQELRHYGLNKEVLLSRPCIYGVFSGPVGGFAPREHLCVGCLRCTTEHPDVVQIHRNPEHARLGDSYFTAEHVETVAYEARTGTIPVRGAGYRGPFGGEGWDGMWTDMSEIVRPTRDGIHGREFISTVVDIGSRPPFLEFDASGLLNGELPQTFSLPIPMLFDAPPPSLMSRRLATVLVEAARATETVTILPASAIVKFGLRARAAIPLVTQEDDVASLAGLGFEPLMIEMAAWDDRFYREIRARFPNGLVGLRLRYA